MKSATSWKFLFFVLGKWMGGAATAEFNALRLLFRAPYVFVLSFSLKVSGQGKEERLFTFLVV